MRRKSLPVPVFLKRLAMDLRIFCMRKLEKMGKTQVLTVLVKGKREKKRGYRLECRRLKAKPLNNYIFDRFLVGSCKP